MNVIKKTVAILFIFSLSACSTEFEELEEQSVPITSSLRTQEGNSISETIIQFREHISEAQREDIRDYLISSGFLIDFYPSSIGPDIEIWIHRNLCIWDPVLRRHVYWDVDSQEFVSCPITPIGTLEDDGVINIFNPRDENHDRP